MVKSSVDELVAFISIVDSGSIVAAAKQLHLTTSGVSRALQRLESKLNVTLIERTTRKIKLTQEGQLFLKRARKIMHDLNEAEDALLQSDRDTSGLIRVDSATAFVWRIVVPLLSEFAQLYPNIDIELNTNDQFIDLLEHKTDVAIRFGDLSDSSLHAKLLCTSRLYLVASPAYLQQYGHPQTVDELMQHPQIGFSKAPRLNEWPLYIEGERFKSQSKFTASSGETVRQLALHGLGIACLSAFLIQKDLEQHQLISLFDGQLQMNEHKIHAVYYQQEHLPKRVRLFIEFLAERISDFV